MPCPYKSRVTSDNFGVGKRHCRLLHRPHGRWFHRIGQWLNRIGRWLNRIGRSIYFTHYPKFGDGSAVSLQIRGYIRPFWGVGKRHCRVLHRPTGRWFHRIGQWLNRIGRWLNRIGRSIDFTHYPKFGDGSAVSLQIRGYIRPW